MISSLLFLLTPAALAAVNVVASTPDVAWLVQRVAGDNAKVQVLAPPGASYHHVEARPDYALKVARADVLCRIGLELEDPWLNKVVEKAANGKVMDGSAGDCVLGRKVDVGQKPTGAVDRSMGDVHPSGNPHFWLSPVAMAAAVKEVEERLSQVDAGNASTYAANRAAVEKELLGLEKSLKEKLKPAAGRAFFEYHKDFFYFFRDYGLVSLGSIEEIPGVAPSAARLGTVAKTAKAEKAALALAAKHDPAAQLEKFRELSGVSYVQVPTSVPNPTDPGAYAAWQEEIVKGILGKL